jgi:F-type H+-transporting ATPase subunit epsilon
MAASLLLEVVTPDRPLLKETVLLVEVPGANGALGILPSHAPLLSELGSGPLIYTLPDGRRKSIAISGGFVEVLPEQVRVLAMVAEAGDEVDVKRAEEALHRAEERLSHPTPDLDVARALNAMKRAQARLAAAKLHQA